MIASSAKMSSSTETSATCDSSEKRQFNSLRKLKRRLPGCWKKKAYFNKAIIGQLDVTIEERRVAAALGLGLCSWTVTSNLQTHNIDIQAYHSRSFVGNQYLKEVVFTDLCNSISVKTAELAENLRIIQTAEPKRASPGNSRSSRVSIQLSTTPSLTATPFQC